MAASGGDVPCVQLMRRDRRRSGRCLGHTYIPPGPSGRRARHSVWRFAPHVDRCGGWRRRRDGRDRSVGGNLRRGAAAGGESSLALRSCQGESGLPHRRRSVRTAVDRFLVLHVGPCQHFVRTFGPDVRELHVLPLRFALGGGRAGPGSCCRRTRPASVPVPGQASASGLPRARPRPSARLRGEAGSGCGERLPRPPCQRAMPMNRRMPLLRLCHKHLVRVTHVAATPVFRHTHARHPTDRHSASFTPYRLCRQAQHPAPPTATPGRRRGVRGEVQS
jgi:hypothetical protein